MMKEKNDGGVLRNIALRVFPMTAPVFWAGSDKAETGAGKGRTVQEEIEKALAKMHGHPVSVIGSGRTDSGVHAAGQVANFFTDISSIDRSAIYQCAQFNASKGYPHHRVVRSAAVLSCQV